MLSPKFFVVVIASLNLTWKVDCVPVGNLKFASNNDELTGHVVGRERRSLTKEKDNADEDYEGPPNK